MASLNLSLIRLNRKLEIEKRNLFKPIDLYIKANLSWLCARPVGVTASRFDLVLPRQSGGTEREINSSVEVGFALERLGPGTWRTCRVNQRAFRPRIVHMRVPATRLYY